MRTNSRYVQGVAQQILLSNPDSNPSLAVETAATNGIKPAFAGSRPTLGQSAQADFGAPVSVHGQRGESPRQAYALRPVTERKGVIARWGPKQREVNDQSVG